VDSGASRANLKHHAWQASGSVFLTGEKASFKTITPRKPFDPARGDWGAFEIAARYGEVTLDDATYPAFASRNSAASKARALGLGLNWYLAKYIKVVVDFEQTRFTGGAAAGADRETERFLDTRFQFGF
jgi:phosphate-selective porin OprO/OprP